MPPLEAREISFIEIQKLKICHSQTGETLQPFMSNLKKGQWKTYNDTKYHSLDITHALLKTFRGTTKAGVEFPSATRMDASRNRNDRVILGETFTLPKTSLRNPSAQLVTKPFTNSKT